MKIAIPTNDGVNISRHFGRSDSFLIFEVEDRRIIGREARSSASLCFHDHHTEGHGCSGGSGQSREGVVSTLGDCQVVICCGIGNGAGTALRVNGIRTILTNPGLAEDAVASYLVGTLLETTQSACHCGH